MKKEDVFTIVTSEPKKDTESLEENVTFDDALARTGYGMCNFKVTGIGALAIGSSYIGVAAVSLILPAAHCDLQMNSFYKGNLISAGFIGIILSCHMWGFLSDTKGRRKVVLCCAWADGLLYSITSLSPYYSFFLVLRFLHGFATCGVVVPIYAYVGEFHSDKHRNKAMLFASIFGCFGYFYIVGVGWAIIPSTWQMQILPGFIYKSWRLYYALLGIPSLLCAIAITFLPESPKFFMAIDQRDRALEVLRRVHKENGSRVPGSFTVKSLSGTFDRDARSKCDGNKISEFFSLMWSQTVPLFKSPHRRNIALICSVQYLLYLCNNGIFLWLPETSNRIAIFVKKNEGVSATFCNIVQNFDGSDGNLTSQKEFDLLTDNIVSTRISGDNNSIQECEAVVEERVFFTMMCMTSCMTMSLISLSVLLNFFPKKAVLCLFISVASAVTSCLTFTTGTYILLVEMGSMLMLTGAAVPIITNLAVDVFPTNFRAMAVCLTIMSARLGTITANQICGSLLDSHCIVIIWILTASLTVCIIISVNLPTNKIVKN